MKDNDCIFCKIAAGEIPSATLYEDDDFRVILDLGPASKGHALIIPKEHYRNLYDIDEELASKESILIGSKIDEESTPERFEKLKAKYGDMKVLPLSIYMDDTVESVRKALLELSGERKEDGGFTSRMDTDAHYRDEA